MALDPAPIFDAGVSHAMSLGLFENVNGSPAQVSPGYGLAYFFEFVRMTAVRTSGLDTTSVRIQFAGHIYTTLEQEPADQIDPHVLTATGRLWQAYAADFTLGGLVRCVDVFGAHGEPLDARGGYPEINTVKIRAVTFDLPVIVDDVFPQVP